MRRMAYLQSFQEWNLKKIMPLLPPFKRPPAPHKPKWPVPPYKTPISPSLNQTTRLQEWIPGIMPTKRSDDEEDEEEKNEEDSDDG